MLLLMLLGCGVHLVLYCCLQKSWLLENSLKIVQKNSLLVFHLFLLNYTPYHKKLYTKVVLFIELEVPMTKKEPVDRNVDVFYSINTCWHVFVYCSTNTAPFLPNSFAIVPWEHCGGAAVIIESAINLVYSFERPESVMEMKLPFNPQTHPKPSP